MYRKNKAVANLKSHPLYLLARDWVDERLLGGLSWLDENRRFQINKLDLSYVSINMKDVKCNLEQAGINSSRTKTILMYLFVKRYFLSLSIGSNVDIYCQIKFWQISKNSQKVIRCIEHHKQLKICSVEENCWRYWLVTAKDIHSKIIIGKLFAETKII
jgi:hypothetical protein